MIITDIKNCKIRVESKEHSKAIQESAFEYGFKWLFSESLSPIATSFIFFEEDEIITQGKNEKDFIDSEEKEIFFYDNNFHDEPQKTTKEGMEAMNSDKNKVTVKQFLEAGFELISGDVVGGVKITESQAHSANSENSNIMALDFYVDELAWRDNTGIQPVGDDCLVETMFAYDDRITVDRAYIWMWDDENLTHWRPSLKHLENKMNDNQEQKLATEMSERDVYDAVSIEWVNGDECCNDEYGDGLVFIGDSKIESNMCYVERFDGEYVDSFYVPKESLKKPLTPEKKEEQARLAAIEAMMQVGSTGGIFDCNELKWACEKIYDAGYRKEEL